MALSRAIYIHIFANDMRFAPKIPYLTNISSPLFDPNKTKKIFKNDAAEFRLYTALAGIFFSISN